MNFTQFLLLERVQIQQLIAISHWNTVFQAFNSGSWLGSRRANPKNPYGALAIKQDSFRNSCSETLPFLLSSYYQPYPELLLRKMVVWATFDCTFVFDILAESFPSTLHQYVVNPGFHLTYDAECLNVEDVGYAQMEVDALAAHLCCPG